MRTHSPVSGGSTPRRLRRGWSATLLLVCTAAALASTAAATGCDSGVLQMKPLPQGPDYDPCFAVPLTSNSIKALCTVALRVRVKGGVVKIVPLSQDTYNYTDVGPSLEVNSLNCKDANASGYYYPGSTTSASLMLYDDFGGPLSNLTKTGANQVTLTVGRTYAYRGPYPACRYNYTVVQGCVLGVKAPAKPAAACPAGYISTKGRFGTPYCAPCPPGTYSPKAGATCKACPVGTYSATLAATKCTKCTANYYTNTTGAATCVYCSTYDNFWTDGKQCRKCPRGSYASMSSPAQCARCYKGKRCCTVNWDKDCPKCTGAPAPPTTYTSIFALDATTTPPCRATRHALCAPKINITVDATCTISVNNLDYSNNPDDDTFCPWGIETPVKGAQLSIRDLASFDYVSDDASLLTGNFTAAASPYLTVSIPATKCTLRYRALTAPAAALLGAAPKPSKPTTCPAGQYQDTTTDTKPGPCLLCPPGTYSPAPSTGRNCIRCPAGTYARGYGNVKCKRCPVSRASKAGAAWCGLCDSGSQPAPGGKGCKACPKNSDITFRGAGGQCLGNAYGSVCCAAGDCKGQAPCKGPRKDMNAGQSETYTAVLQLVSKSLPQPSCRNATVLSCLPANGKLQLITASYSPSSLTLQAYRTTSTCANFTVSYLGGYTSTKAAYLASYDDSLQANVAYGLLSDATKGTLTMYLAQDVDQDTVGQTPVKAQAACSATLKVVNGYAFDLKPPQGAKCDPQDVVATYGGRKFCQVCPSGQFKAASGACRDCPSGFYNDQAGANTCKPCRAGYSCYSGSSMEFTCGAGTYSAKPKQGSCAECPANTYGSPDFETPATKCTPCPKGTVAPANARACGVPWDKAFPA